MSLDRFTDRHLTKAVGPFAQFLHFLAGRAKKTREIAGRCIYYDSRSDIQNLLPYTKSRKFINVLTKARHGLCSEHTQSTLHMTSHFFFLRIRSTFREKLRKADCSAAGQEQTCLLRNTAFRLFFYTSLAL
jgi:hypothetical protein